MYTISRRESFSDTTFLWDVMAPDVAKSAEPGHFVMLRLHEGSERIPLTVADYDREAGTVTLVVQALGKTTLEMRDRYKEGDTFTDFVGPLGPAAARRQVRPRRPGRRRPRRGAGVPAAARVQGGGQPHHRHHRLPQQGPRLLGREVRRAVRQPDRLHRRRQLRQAGLRHRGAAGSARAGQARPRRRDRPAADDERVRRDHAAVRREDDGVAERDHGRRHRACADRAGSRSAARSSSPASTGPTSTATRSTSRS